MLSFAFLGSRARFVAVLAAAGACVAAAVASFAACLTAPPPDVGTECNAPPQIEQAAVYPPPGPIQQWPTDGFRVPVVVPCPSGSCNYAVVDRDYEGVTQTRELVSTCSSSIEDGGVATLEFGYSLLNPDHCHRITFVVGHQLTLVGGLPVPDSVGGDIVTWDYSPPYALCNFYDAGVAQDGAFPTPDAFDGPLVVPDSGADP